MGVYQRIDGAGWRNIWVVGDIHGCFSRLMAHLQRVGFEPNADLLISVGDVIDRGNEGLASLGLIAQPWFRAVCGNHEQMMLSALNKNAGKSLWIANGGGWFFQLPPGEQRQVRALLPVVASLPLIIELMTGNRKYVICHADYPFPAYAFDKPVDPMQVLWRRTRIERAQRGRVERISGADLFIFGHTPVTRRLKFANQLYIDTGAVFGGTLSVICVQRAHN